MKIIEPGHIYELEVQDREEKEHLTFVNREDNPHGGTQTQEVLRALIDRTMHCDNCLRWEGNDLVIYHLRMALVLHEARALQRKVVKGLLEPELADLGPDGHFQLGIRGVEPKSDHHQHWVTKETPSEGGLGEE